MKKPNVRYKNKAPFSTLHPDPCHWTRKGNSWKQKAAYESEDEAAEYLELNPKLKILGYRVYVCKICSLYHIGHLH